jgi:histidinol-phosphate aminotransferase
MRSCRIRQTIRDIPPYVPGKSINEVARELGLRRITKLASNESAIGPSPLAMKAIRKHLRAIHRYPEDSSYDLKQALARHHGVKAENIIMGTGADEVLLLLGHLFLDPGDECLYPFPSFPLYRKSTLAMAGVPVESPLRDFRIDVDDMLARVTPRTRLAFLCNPNNPTGDLVAGEQVVSFLERLPEHVFPVIDEAYAEFVTDPRFQDGVGLFRKGYHLASVRTFSKIFGIAGLRVGYAVVPPDLAIAVNGIRNSFNISCLAQVAALAALGDARHVARTRSATFAGRDHLFKGLQDMGLHPIPSETNFVCVGVNRSAEEVSRLLLRQGLIIRPLTAFSMPDHIRVTVGTPKENRALLEALASVLEAHG